MKKTNVTSSQTIGAMELLSLYDAVIPLLSYNPKKLDPVAVLRKKVAEFIQFDSFHYAMRDPESLATNPFRSFYDELTKDDNKKIEISLRAIKDQDRKKSFKEMVTICYQNQLNWIEKEFSRTKDQLNYYRIISYKKPEIVVGFFRFRGNKKRTEFSTQDRAVCKTLSPHIFSLLRMILSKKMQTVDNQHFGDYIIICKAMALQFKLSTTEAKLLPELVFGHSNKAIADRNFISVLTAKTHIHNIFKKTSTKNRLDLIGKFFTSPERIAL